MWINGKKVLVLGMIADGGDESLLLTRFVDSDEYDSAELWQFVKTFLENIHALYPLGGCRFCGFTQYAIEMLRDGITFPLDGGMKTVGFAGNLEDDVFNECVARMVPWLKLCHTTCDAEFAE